MGNVTKVAGKEIAVGFPRGKCQAYPDGEQVAQVAFENCMGDSDKRIPARDFMGYAQDGIEQRTRPIIRKIGKLASEPALLNPGVNDAKISALREAAGQAGAAAVKSAIRDGSYEPNSPRTLHPSVGGVNPDGKKSTKPLIDTGHMIQSVTHVVRDRS